MPAVLLFRIEGWFVLSWRDEKEQNMNVQLDPKDKKDLEALARASGMNLGEMLRKLLHEALVERKRNGAEPQDDAESIRLQQGALRELHETLDALPPEGPEDGFRGRDHDQVLYGKRP